MNSSAPNVRFGDFLKINLRPYTLAPDQDANLVGVKWYGEGPFHREYKLALNIAKKSHFVIRAGDVIYNKLFAWKGSFGIVPSDLDGMYVSDKFPTYTLDRNRVDENYLKWYFHYSALWDQARDMSTGSAALSKFTLNPPKFLELTMPLPPLIEQQHTAVMLERLVAKIMDAKTERTRAEKDIEYMKRSFLSSIFSSTEFESQKLEDACEAIIDNLHSTPKYNGNEFPCVRSQDVNNGCINFLSALKTGVDEFNERIRRAEPRTGDIVYVREGDVGRCAVVDGMQRFSLGQRVMMFRPDTRRVAPKFLFYQLISPPFHEDQVLGSMTGTTSRHVNIKDLRDMNIIIPPLPDQRRIVAQLDRLQAKVDEVKRLQAETEIQIAALIPSILNKTFMRA